LAGKLEPLGERAAASWISSARNYYETSSNFEIPSKGFNSEETISGSRLESNRFWMV
jgi:hypothetical protein